MNEVWCFDCQNVFDDQKGHHCVHGWSIPKNVHGKNVHFLSNVDKNDYVSQLNSPIKSKESSYPTLVISEVENAKHDISDQTSFNNLETMQLFQLSAESAPENNYDQFQIINSVQSNLKYYAIRETDGQTSTNQVYSIGCNLPLESSIQNSQIVVDNCGTNDIRSQLSTFEKSSMSNSVNKHRDLNTARMNVDSLMLNIPGSEFPSKKHQQNINVKTKRLLSENTQDQSQERKLITELVTEKVVLNKEVVSKDTRKSEMSRQFSVSREINLENMYCPTTIKEHKSNTQLNSSNISAVGSKHYSTFTGCLNSHANELTFGNQIHHREQKQIVPTENMNQPTKSIKPCLTGAIDAVIRPSCSLGSKRTCPICRKQFSSKTYLKYHLNLHSGARPYVCNVCTQNFNNAVILKRHIREIHMGEKPHKCEICEKLFARKDKLGSHIRSHKGEKTHKCKICGKLFARKDNLGSHIRTHKGEKTHKWEICGKLFVRKDKLGSHIRTHTGEKNP